MSFKCFHCKKEINEFSPDTVWSFDGDSFCNKKCEDSWREQMGVVCNMSDAEFYKWIGGEDVFDAR